MNRCAYSALVALTMLTACEQSPDPTTKLTASAPTDLVTHDLEGTRWVPLELLRIVILPIDNRHEQYIVLQSGDHSVVGNAGCHRLASKYELNGSTLTFSKLPTEPTACPDTQHEALLIKTLECTASWRIIGAHLELFDAAGDVLARFESRNL